MYNFAVGPGNGGSFGLLYDLENIDFTQTVRKYVGTYIFLYLVNFGLYRLLCPNNVSDHYSSKSSLNAYRSLEYLFKRRKVIFRGVALRLKSQLVQSIPS